MPPILVTRRLASVRAERGGQALRELLRNEMPPDNHQLPLGRRVTDVHTVHCIYYLEDLPHPLYHLDLAGIQDEPPLQAMRLECRRASGVWKLAFP